MSPSNDRERRDPYSPVLRLATVLTRVRTREESGWIEVVDRGRSHHIQIQEGTIANLRMTGDNPAELFTLPRPHVIWTPCAPEVDRSEVIDPVTVVLRGIIARRDLFDPKILAMRIPVTSLTIDHEKMTRLRALPFAPAELSFLESLHVPTPIPMILWKRGLDPSHAGALIVALNILGLWKNWWEPGLLPRNFTATSVMRKLKEGADDLEMLGVSENPVDGEIERAFRKLSFDLHPDRATGLSAREAELVREAYQAASGSYTRLSRSRRSRPVRVPDGEPIAKVRLTTMRPDSWAGMLHQARRAAADGELTVAKAYALKGLGLSPTEAAREELSDILRLVA